MTPRMSRSTRRVAVLHACEQPRARRFNVDDFTVAQATVRQAIRRLGPALYGAWMFSDLVAGEVFEIFPAVKQPGCGGGHFLHNSRYECNVQANLNTIRVVSHRYPQPPYLRTGKGTTSAGSAPVMTALARSVAARKGSSSRCEYLKVVCAVVWPSNWPMTGSDNPADANTLA